MCSHSAADPLPASRRWRLIAALLVVLAVAFALHALAAARTKSSTFDEPVHALSSWLIVNRGDFRVNPEHPALWKYIAGLPLIGHPLEVDLAAPAAAAVLEKTEQQWWWAVDVLYGADRTRFDGERLVARGRLAMGIFPLLVALVVARWAWAFGGPAAAVVATLLLVLDPNFLAHGSLVTNDVAATFCFAAATYLTWQLGRRAAWTTAALLTLVCAAGVGIKFTCLLLAPMVTLPLVIRAATVERRGRAIGGVAGFGVVAAIFALACLWPLYQFRSAPTPAGDRFDADYARKLLAYNTIDQQARQQGAPLSDASIKARVSDFKTGPLTRTITWMGEQRIVPQAWTYGLAYAEARSIIRPSYLMGEYSDSGFRSFFPLAVLFKTPTATLALIAVAAVLGAIRLGRGRVHHDLRWKLVCLVAPAMLYFAVAVFSNLNIGVRHVLPIYPAIFVAVGVVAADCVRRWRRAKAAVAVLIALLAIEMGVAFPNYLGFFNLPSRTLASGGGLALLSDSNLDWGQDLPALAEFYHAWRPANPGRPFYLSYFGTVDPHVYGIDYINAAAGYPFDRTAPTMNFGTRGGLLAISATQLQGVYPAELRPFMAALRASEPYAVIGDSIYIYALPESRP